MTYQLSMQLTSWFIQKGLLKQQDYETQDFLKKDKIIIQIIFCIGQIGVFFTWFGTPGINTCCGIETILILNYLYPLCVVLFEYFLWAHWRPEFLIAVYGVLFLDALLAVYIWWKRYSFFIGDILFEMRYILPGYYAYLAMMAVAFIITVIYTKIGRE